jgi:hypothetical protein
MNARNPCTISHSQPLPSLSPKFFAHPSESTSTSRPPPRHTSLIISFFSIPHILPVNGSSSQPSTFYLSICVSLSPQPWRTTRIAVIASRATATHEPVTLTRTMILVVVIDDTSETLMYPAPAPTRSRKSSATTPQAQSMPTSVLIVHVGRGDPCTKICAVPPPSADTTHTTMHLTEAPVLVGQDTTRINVSDIELMWLKLILISLRLPSPKIRV